MIKRCVRCGKEFDGHPSAKYCRDCRVDAKQDCDRRYRDRHREQIREYYRQYRARKKLERRQRT